MRLTARWATILLALPGSFWACKEPGEEERLHLLFEREWEGRLAENPLLATSAGRHDFDHLLPSVTAEDERKRAGLAMEFLEESAGIRQDVLSLSGRISLDIFRREQMERITAFQFGAHEIPINADSGFHISFARLPDRMPFDSTRAYENYIARLNAFPAYVDQHIDNMRTGLARGMTLPRVVLEGYDVTISTHAVAAPEDSVFFAPFATFPAAVPERDRARILAAGRESVMNGAVAGYRAFLEFMTNEYIPGARESIGASELPDGSAYYAYLVKHFTTLDVTPAEVHRIGLKEVERIREEMNAAIRETGFQGDFAAFLQFLRSDPRFYAKTPEELLQRASFIAKRMDAKLPSLFHTLPRQPYGVARVPDHLAPKYTGGRYVGAPKDGTRPGYYWVNTYNLSSRPLYTLEALTLHEAVPGHHIQNALADELEGLPEFRKHAYFGAFGEGWGLYSERLGLEAGFYTDPYSNFGRLSYEMWRACRLVVDTGIHSMGWTRQQAMDYMAERTALSLHEIRTETDRYIAWPGQALTYKMGELKFLELRRKAESALGGKFDIREFHDLILSNGEVPLPVLEELVDQYIESASERA